jgi:thiol-disulfide isomerase/thioredoxin
MQAQNKASPVLLVFLIFPLIGLIAAAVVMTNAAPTNPDLLSAITPGANTARVQTLAPNFQLNLLDGTPMQLTDYRGRVVFLNFWRTDCAPCREELPDFAAFMTAYADQPNSPLVLAINLGETPEQINTYFQDNNIGPIPVVLDPVGVARSIYGVMPLPTTFVIDGEGVIRALKIGALERAEMDAYLAEVFGQG